jgi:hypothetical protein
MSLKDRLSPEDWKTLVNAPGAASSYVSSASGGGLEVIKEVLSAGRFAQETAAKTGGSGYGELVDDLLAAMKDMSRKEAKESSIQQELTDLQTLRTNMKQMVIEAGKLASDLPGGDGYKRWLLDMVREVAETKTGGFLGIGGKSVIDEKEEAAIQELKVLLGV